jgi:glyoxylase-like metal-dependent hydrolase (beta-lactamase superfamily II)
MEEKHFGLIWFIPGEQGGRYPFCHSVYVEGAGILIDPASDRERLTQLRKNPGVKGVWLSHWHEDHLMHLDLFDDLPLRISVADAPPLSGLDAFLDAYGMEQADERASWRQILVKDFHFRPRTPIGFLQEGLEILADGLTVEILSTPGHTPGHTAFFFPEQGVLFMGDYDLTKFGPWYGDVESSIEETIASIKRLRLIPAKVWITGHETGLFETDPGELWQGYLDVISVREEKLLDLLKQPRTLDAIVEACIIYGKPREPKAFFVFGERANMQKHLEKLMREGIVRCEGERYVRQ